MKDAMKLELEEKLKRTYAEGARMARERGNEAQALAIAGAWKPVYEYMIWFDELYQKINDPMVLMEVVLPSIATVMVDMTKHITLTKDGEDEDEDDPDPDTAEAAQARIETVKHMAAQVYKIGALMINAKAGLGKMPPDSQMDTLTVGGN